MLCYIVSINIHRHIDGCSDKPTGKFRLGSVHEDCGVEKAQSCDETVTRIPVGASWRWWVGHTQSQHSEVRSSPSLACFHARPSGSIFYEDRRGLHKCAAPYTHRWTAKSAGCSESSQHGAQQAVKAQAGDLRPAG